MLQRNCTFTVKGKEYTLTIPNIGQLIEIEGSRQELSQGKYNELISSRLVTTQSLLDLIDAQSLLKACCPEFIEDLTTKRKSLLDLSLTDAKQFLDDVYRKQIVSWWVDVNKIFQLSVDE